MQSNLLMTTLAALAAISFGTGDYFGGVAARRDAVLRVVVFGHIFSGIIFTCAAFLTPHEMPHVANIMYAAIAGIGSGCGVAALYRGLALGEAGIVAPLATLLSAAIPVITAITLRVFIPTPVFWLGISLGAIAIIFLTTDFEGAHSDHIVEQLRTGAKDRLRISTLYGVAAGAGFGISLTCFAYAHIPNVFATLAIARAGSICVLGFLLLRARTSLRVIAGRPVIGSACGDAIGNAAYVAAVAGGHLVAVAGITNLYPAVTVVLDASTRRKMPSRLHIAGLILSISAAILISGVG